MLVPLAEAFKSGPISSDDRSGGTLCDGHLPGVVFAEASAEDPGSALKFGALDCVLKAKSLGHKTRDEREAPARIIAAFKKLGNRDGGDQQWTAGAMTIPLQPPYGRPGLAAIDFSLQFDQKRRVKQDRRHVDAFDWSSWPTRLLPNRLVRGRSPTFPVSERGSIQSERVRTPSPCDRAGRFLLW